MLEQTAYWIYGKGAMRFILTCSIWERTSGKTSSIYRYDILHVLDVLTQFDWLRNDSRIREIIDIVKSMANDEGKFSPNLKNRNLISTRFKT
jgi:hypothetical protein